MIILPALCGDECCCDLAQQCFDGRGELRPLSRPQLDARFFEQAWLEIFGLIRHYWPSPILIRTGESLEDRRPGHAESEGYQARNWAWRRSRIEMPTAASSKPGGRQTSHQAGAPRST